MVFGNNKRRFIKNLRRLTIRRCYRNRVSHKSLKLFDKHEGRLI